MGVYIDVGLHVYRLYRVVGLEVLSQASGFVETLTWLLFGGSDMFGTQE